MTAICPAGHESATDDYCDVCGAVMMPTTPRVVSGPPVVTASGPACPNCGAPHDPGDAFCEVCGLDFATGDLPQPPPPPEPLDPESQSAAPAPTPEAAGEGGEEEPVPRSEPDAEAEAGPKPESPPAAEAAEAEEKAEEKVEGKAAAPRAPASGEWYVVVEPDHRWFERNEAEGTTGAVPFPEDTSPLQLTLTGDEVLVGRRSDTRTAQPDVEVEDPGVSRRHALLRRQPDGGWVIVDEQSTNGTWIAAAADPIRAGETVPLTDGATVHIGAFTRLTIRRA